MELILSNTHARNTSQSRFDHVFNCSENHAMLQVKTQNNGQIKIDHFTPMWIFECLLKFLEPEAIGLFQLVPFQFRLCEFPTMQWFWYTT